MALLQTAAPRGSETILLVERDPETRKLAVFMLQKQGYTTLEARNRAEALAAVQGRVADVALALIEVRGRGSELAEELKQRQPTMKVLLICAESRTSSRSPAGEGLPILRKPFTMAEIATKVRQVIDMPLEKVMIAGGVCSG
jgi:CheY-like chemotaxis protein